MARRKGFNIRSDAGSPANFNLGVQASSLRNYSQPQDANAGYAAALPKKRAGKVKSGSLGPGPLKNGGLAAKAPRNRRGILG